MDDLSFYAIAFLRACDKHLANYETSGYLQTVLDHRMHIWNFKIKAVELAIEARLLNENSHHGYSIQLQHHEQISEFSEALFPSHLQACYSVNCVPDGSWVYCGEVFKVTQSEELSDT